MAEDKIEELKAEIDRLNKAMDSMVLEHTRLIKTTNAEIQRLKNINIKLDKYIVRARDEAVKEFSERLKEQPIKYELPLLGLPTRSDCEEYLNGIMLQIGEAMDKLVEEMMWGDNNGENIIG